MKPIQINLDMLNDIVLREADKLGVDVNTNAGRLVILNSKRPGAWALASIFMDHCADAYKAVVETAIGLTPEIIEAVKEQLTEQMKKANYTPKDIAACFVKIDSTVAAHKAIEATLVSSGYFLVEEEDGRFGFRERPRS